MRNRSIKIVFLFGNNNEYKTNWTLHESKISPKGPYGLIPTFLKTMFTVLLIWFAALSWNIENYSLSEENSRPFETSYYNKLFAAVTLRDEYFILFYLFIYLFIIFTITIITIIICFPVLSRRNSSFFKCKYIPFSSFFLNLFANNLMPHLKPFNCQ